MAGRGRFGKYGDLKRKEQIRSTRVSRAGPAKASFAVAGAVREERLGKSSRKK